MPLGEDRQQILVKYGPYVRSLASTVRRQFNAQLELDELMAYGQVGLLEAAERFDAKLGANFLTFAHYRIKGAIFDGLRKMGVLKGSDVRTVYLNERTSAYLGNLADRDQGSSNLGGGLSDDVRELSSAVTGLAVALATGMEGAEGLQLPDDSIPADQRLELEELKTRVRGAIDQLPEKERKLLEAYYFQAKTLEEAGAEIGQSKSWASRLHARAVERLKDMLSEEKTYGATQRTPVSDAARATKSPGAQGLTSRKTGSVKVRPDDVEQNASGWLGSGRSGRGGGTTR